MEEEREGKKVTYSDLSTSLKLLVVLCWILVGLYGLSFLIGIIMGMAGI